MMRKQVVWGLLAVCLAVYAVDAAEKTAAATEKDDTSMTPTKTPAHHSEVQPSYHDMLTYGGAGALGSLLVVLLVGLVMQVFGLRVCQLMGNCDASTAYGSSGAGTAYQNDGATFYTGQSTQYPYPSGNTYQKRSVDYVSPVINMLRSAYEKYGQNTFPLTTKKLS